MTGSPAVLAADDGASVPDCADYWLCQKVAATGAMPTILRPLRTRAPQPGDAVDQITARRTQRAAATGSVRRSFAPIVIVGIAVVRVLGELGHTDQWRVGRELRMRLEERFVAEGIRTPLPLLGNVSGAGTGLR